MKKTIENLVKVGKGFALGTGLAMALAVAGCAEPSKKNHAPNIISNCPTEVYEGQPYSCQVVATDKNRKDRNRLEYSLIDAPDWLSINQETGEISGTAPMITGDTPFYLEVKVRDRKGKRGTEEVSVNILDTPILSLIPDFGNGYSGNVAWNATVSGPVDSMEISTNQGPGQKFYNTLNQNTFEVIASVPIEDGNGNIVNVIACRDSPTGAESYCTTAQNSFYSPANQSDENQLIRPVINEEFSARGYVEGVDYEKDVPIYGGDPTTLIVERADYFVELPGGRKFAVIYINHSDNDAEQESLNNSEIENYFFKYLPDNVVGKEVKSIP